MDTLNKLKNLSPTIAGIVYTVYAAILMLAGVRGMYVVMALAILGVGITCFIEKAESVKMGLLLLCAVLSFFSVFSTFFDFVRMLFEGVISFIDFIRIPLSLFTAALRVISLAMLAALVFVSWKKMQSIITKFWYAPAAVTVVAALIDAFIRAFNLIAYGISFGHFFFGLLFDTIMMVVLSVIYAVGQAALGLSTISDAEKVEVEACCDSQPVNVYEAVADIQPLPENDEINDK